MCRNKKEQIKELIGNKFNRLTVIELDHIDKKYNKYYKCQCDCGNYTIVAGFSIKSGGVKSCGCLRTEKAYKTHGLSSSKLQPIWVCMKQRCNNPNNKAYKYYGARGISVCDEWENSFVEFYNWSMNNGYKEGLTIDRIDNNYNYCPENCRWVDRITQSNNTRNNHLVSHNGETQTLTQWAREYGKNPKQFSHLYRKLGSINLVLDYYECIKKGIPFHKDKHIMVTYKNETKALSVFCKELRLNYNSVMSRIFQRNWSIDKALSTPMRQKYEIEYNGNIYNIKEVALLNGINPASLKYQYIKNNKDIYRAVQHFKGE